MGKYRESSSRRERSDPKGSSLADQGEGVGSVVSSSSRVCELKAITSNSGDKNLQYFILKLQHNANILQGSHFLFTFSINKIDVTLISYLTLILSPNAKLFPNPSLTLTLTQNVYVNM